MQQELIRQRLNKFLAATGVKQSFICKKISLPNSVMSQFLRGKKDLFPNHLEMLEQYLNDNKF